MNFFEHQDRARRQTRWLVFLFILAVVAIVAAIDLVLLIVAGKSRYQPGGPVMPLADIVRLNLPLLAGGAVAALAVIGLASLFKITALRAGGGEVARQLGGALVESDTRDPKRRRLRNVVEEIALASGVPVPEIYVLEQESGINAFAAGFTPSDAAVAVTRGVLEKLSRNELQGVIAHEFSHILNGDMRINIRLMGTLFGILVLALIGRRVLIHSQFMGRSRDRNGAVVVLLAFGLIAIGYIGLFFGRWIKAAVSRQREFLADASAVQFTRDPDGIGGALKKIAVYSEASYLNADTEEISHMLFGDGRKMFLFSTHPPIELRIARIDPSFRPEDLDRLAARIQMEQIQEAKAAKRAHSAQAAAGAKRFSAGGVVDSIGSPDFQRLLMAAALAGSIPDNVRRAAHSAEWAPEVLFYTLLDRDKELREKQLLNVARIMGEESERQVRALLEAGGPPAAEQRLPLLEMAFPALKRRPPEYVGKVLETVKALVEADGRVDVFEYLLARVISLHLWESHNPHRVRLSGNKTLNSLRDEALAVLAVLARHGSPDDAMAREAFAAGVSALGLDVEATLPQSEDWVSTMDGALSRLDGLKAADKEKLVQAMVAVAAHDGRLLPAELELLRAACSLIHAPLPMLSAAPQTSPQS